MPQEEEIDQMGECHNCGDEVPSEKLEEAPDGNLYCEGCMEESCTCNKCGNWGLNGDDFSWTPSGYPLCSNCYTRCHNCEDVFRHDDTYEYDGEYYCESCYNDIAGERPLYQNIPGGNWYFENRGEKFGPFGTEEEALDYEIPH